jgi:hypothetical protein
MGGDHTLLDPSHYGEHRRLVLSLVDHYIIVTSQNFREHFRQGQVYEMKGKGFISRDASSDVEESFLRHHAQERIERPAVGIDADP